MRSFSSSKHRLMRARRFLSKSGFVIFLYFAVLDNGAGSADIFFDIPVKINEVVNIYVILAYCLVII